MAFQATDMFLINRSGTSYKVTAAELADKVQAGDFALVNRSGVSYKLTGTNLSSNTFGDTDLFLVNRAGVSYQVAGSEVKATVTSAIPPVSDATWTFVSKNTSGSNFRLTFTAAIGRAFDFSRDTKVFITLAATDINGDGRRHLLSAANIAGSVYSGEFWTSAATQVELRESFTSGNGGNQLSFELFIPNTVDIGADPFDAIDTVINGVWTGTFKISQEADEVNGTMNQFTANDSYFN